MPEEVFVNRLLIGLSIITFLYQDSHADEGMYYPSQLPYEAIQIAYPDVVLTPEKIKQVASAAVKISSGGSGSFVSPNGLVLTNQHVAYACLQDLRSQGLISAEKTGFATDSYFAHSLEEELPCETYQLHQTLDVTDVTELVVPNIPRGTPQKEVDKFMKDISKKLVSLCEGISPSLSQKDYSDAQDELNIVCKFNPARMIEKFYLEKIKVYRDVRLVYIPSSDAAFIGGDALNFQYPRHAVDAAFLRAYGNENQQVSDTPCKSCSGYGETQKIHNALTGKVEKRFKGLETNEPLNTDTFYLRPSTKTDIKNGDFVMVVGHPYRTTRLRSHHKSDFDQNIKIPITLAVYSAKESVIQARIDELSGTEDPDLIKEREALKSQRSRLMNTFQYYKGVSDGLARLDILNKGIEKDNALSNAIQSNGTFQIKYGHLFKSLETINQTLNKYSMLSELLSTLKTNGVFKAPTTLLELVTSDLPNETTDEKKTQFVENTALLSTDVNVSISILAVAIEMIQSSQSNSNEENIFLSWIAEIQGYEKLNPFDIATNLIRFGLKGSNLYQNKEKRLNLLSLKLEELSNEGDTLLSMAIQIHNTAKAIDEKLSLLTPQQKPLRTLYAKALEEVMGQTMGYEDANYSLRISYGKVAGYQKGTQENPIDVASHTTFSTWAETTLDGTLLSDLFTADEANHAAQSAAVFQDQVINFISTLDITGGNSGSPILNKDLKVVGAAFDGNWEMIATDFMFDNTIGRTVSVSLPFVIQYMNADAAEGLGNPEAIKHQNRISLELTAAERGESIFEDGPPQFLFPRGPDPHEDGK
jgi:hypothetical protein